MRKHVALGLAAACGLALSLLTAFGSRWATLAAAVGLVAVIVFVVEVRKEPHVSHWTRF